MTDLALEQGVHIGTNVPVITPPGSQALWLSSQAVELARDLASPVVHLVLAEHVLWNITRLVGPFHRGLSISSPIYRPHPPEGALFPCYSCCCGPLGSRKTPRAGKMKANR